MAGVSSAAYICIVPVMKPSNHGQMLNAIRRGSLWRVGGRRRRIASGKVVGVYGHNVLNDLGVVGT